MSEATEFWNRVLTTVRELDQRSYYELLGVAQSATSEEIRAAYYRLVQTIHPDRHLMNSDTQKQAALVRLNARVGEAYRVLSSQERRRAYDSVLAAGKMRLSGTDETTMVTRTGADPKTPQGKALYQKGLGLLQNGDRKGAKAQLELAIQFEPDSQAIRTALSNLAEEDRERPSSVVGGAGQSRVARPSQPPMSSIAADVIDTPSNPGWEPLPPGGSAPGLARSQARSTAPVAPGGTVSGPASALASGPVSTTLASGSQPGSIVVRCSTADRVAALYERISRADAVLVRTSATPVVGARVPVAVQLPDGAFVEVSGLVMEVRGGERPGVKLSFDGVMADAAKQAFLRALGQQAAAEDPARAGRAALAAHRYAEARELLARALSRAPGDRGLRARYYLALGYEALQGGDARQGELHIQTAEHFEPGCRDSLK